MAPSSATKPRGRKRKKKQYGRNKKPKTETVHKKKSSAKLVAEDDGGDWYQAENVVDARKNDMGGWEFRVRWVGFGPNDDTWEPESNLCDTLFESARKFKLEMDETLQKDLEDLCKEDPPEVEEQLQVDETIDVQFTNEGDTSQPEMNDDGHQKNDEVGNDAAAAAELWEWNDQEQVTFRDIQRININDPDAKERITAARENGTPVCLIGHVGWAQFASRWLRKPSGEHDEKDPAGGTNEETSALPIEANNATSTLSEDTDGKATALPKESKDEIATLPKESKEGTTTLSEETDGKTTILTEETKEATSSGEDTAEVTASSTEDMAASSVEGSEEETKEPSEGGLKSSTPEETAKETAASSETSMEIDQPVARPARVSEGSSVGSPILGTTNDTTIELSDTSSQYSAPASIPVDDTVPTEWLDLSQEWEVDVQKMMNDIGDEFVPVVKKGYDELNPIHKEVPASYFLKRSWPADVGSSEGTSKNVQRLYLHQWQFPLSVAKYKLCGDNCHNPLPNDIFGEDILASYQDKQTGNPFQYIFMGREETMSKIHRDPGGLEITIAPVVGTKEVLLVHRSDGSCIDHLYANLDRINLHRNPLLPHARMYKSVIKPGEILLMPQGTYHQCRNVTPCLSYSRFLLDAVNLRAFFESMTDGDAPEIPHQTIIWNAAYELFQHIDAYEAEVVKQRKNSRNRTAVILDPPVEIVRKVNTLRALRNICRAIHIRYEKGISNPDGLDVCDKSGEPLFGALSEEKEKWAKLLRDVDCTLHDFRFRNSSSKPAFRQRGAPRKASANALAGPSSAFPGSPKSLLEVELSRLPSVVESCDNSHPKIADIGNKVEVTFHGRRAKGVVQKVETSMQAALLQFEGMPLVYNEFQPYRSLRAPVSGESCTEIRAEDVKLGKLVVCRAGQQEYRGVVRECINEDFMFVKLKIGKNAYERWLPFKALLSAEADDNKPTTEAANSMSTEADNAESAQDSESPTAIARSEKSMSTEADNAESAQDSESTAAAGDGESNTADKSESTAEANDSEFTAPDNSESTDCSGDVGMK
ncbi:Chromodomain Y-like protein 2 [Seminavis robusta]|uniref:Chromodomain Y-like protein 2 n=1 Tax=Seminavis robusta TaxID=568900 RepID=A0A9N8HVA5_9STRA|nr:Chromodomain Y-like protein 2 [Seminavis robusta]|eukprot:Sro1908_g304760.1 Chromodomain Y-like protein 2 (1048) ;mRNA; r:10860-14091